MSYCNICHIEYKSKSHLKSKSHRLMNKTNISFNILGEHIKLLSKEDDKKTININYKSHNYFEYIKASQLVSGDIRTIQSHMLFPTDLSIYEEISHEFLRQADIIQRSNEINKI